MSAAPVTTPSDANRRTRQPYMDFSRFFDADQAAQDETPAQQPASISNMDHPTPNGAARPNAARPTSTRSTGSLALATVDLTREDNSEVSVSGTGKSPPRKRQRTSAAQSAARTTPSWQSMCGTLSSIRGDLSSLADSRGRYAKRMEACTKDLDRCSKLLEEALLPVLRRLADVTAQLKEEQASAKAALGSLGGSACSICLEERDCYTVCHPCGHGFFHERCLRTHREEDAKCPVCRARFEPFRVFPA